MNTRISFPKRISEPKPYIVVISFWRVNLHIHRKMYLRQELVQQLAGAQYGGFTGLAVEWEARASEDPLFPAPRSHSTLWRWAHSGIPIKNRTFDSPTGSSIDLSIFGLASLLNVDPLTLFDFERNGYFTDFQMFKYLTYEDSLIAQWGWPIWRMFIPQPKWPDDSIANIFYKQSWARQSLVTEESDDPGVTSWFSIQLPNRTENEPVAVHIAQRRKDTLDKGWRYFGSIIAEGSTADMYDERGEHRSAELTADTRLSFGILNRARPAQWMAACLNPFDASNSANETSTLTFGW